MKNIHIQKIRGVLIFLVIALHSIKIDVNDMYNIVFLFVRNITNIAVPLFIFFAGYFYNFDKQKNNSDYNKNKVKRLLIPLLIWNIIYFFINNKINIKDLLLFKTEAHLYFIVVLIQLILITPCLKKNYILKKILLFSTPIYLLMYRYLLIIENINIPLHQYWIFPWVTYYILGIEFKEKNVKKEKNCLLQVCLF